jgi:hypothetical protein
MNHTPHVVCTHPIGEPCPAPLDPKDEAAQPCARPGCGRPKDDHRGWALGHIHTGTAR